VTEPRRDHGGLDPRLVKALSHPLRFRILERLNAGEASPVNIARELGEPVGRVSHHVRALAQVGAIELVRTVPRRGAIEHFYRPAMRAWFTDQDWQKVPESSRRAIVSQGLDDVVSDIAAAAASGFEWPDMHVSRTPLSLDAEGLAEVVELLNATLDRVVEIQAESRERSAERVAETEVVLLHFERP
jgi:DNA-binding transcriptional ArsR family regulator